MFISLEHVDTSSNDVFKNELTCNSNDVFKNELTCNSKLYLETKSNSLDPIIDVSRKFIYFPNFDAI